MSGSSSRQSAAVKDLDLSSGSASYGSVAAGLAMAVPAAGHHSPDSTLLGGDVELVAAGIGPTRGGAGAREAAAARPAAAGGRGGPSRAAHPGQAVPPRRASWTPSDAVASPGGGRGPDACAEPASGGGLGGDRAVAIAEAASPVVGRRPLGPPERMRWPSSSSAPAAPAGRPAAAWRTVLGSAVGARSSPCRPGRLRQDLQAAALCDALDRLGFELVSEWTRLAAGRRWTGSPVRSSDCWSGGRPSGGPAAATTMLDGSARRAGETDPPAEPRHDRSLGDDRLGRQRMAAARDRPASAGGPDRGLRTGHARLGGPSRYPYSEPTAGASRCA